MSGFAETFAQYIVEVSPNGGSEAPEPEAGAQAVLFVTDGGFTLTIDGITHTMKTGSYAYIPAGAKWQVLNNTDATTTLPLDSQNL